MNYVKPKIRPRISDDDIREQKALLGCLLTDPSMMDRLPGNITEFFTVDEYRELAKLIGEFHDDRRKVDGITLRREMEARGISVSVEEIGQMMRESTHAGYARAYADNVVAAGMLARIRELHVTGLQGVEDATMTPERLLDDIEATVEELRTSTQQDSAESIGEISRRILLSLEEGAPPTMCETGVPAIDCTLGGLKAGEMIVVAARPGCGKTTLAMQSAVHNAERGRNVLFVSLEMTKEELVTRVMAGIAVVPGQNLRTADLSREDREKIRQADRTLHSLPIKIDAPPAATLSDIRREARNQKVRAGLDLIVIDYLSLIKPTGRGERHEKVAEISRGIKQLAKELGAPVLVLQQLNRESDGHEPKLSHLRESGSIEQDADSVLFIHWTGGRDGQGRANVDLIIAKNRHGVVGRTSVQFDPQRGRFVTDYSWDPDR